MSCTATARAIELGDAVVEAIADGWGDTTPADISREWDVPVDDVNLHLLVGRKVWVFVAGYSGNVLNRAEDLNEFRVSVVVVERYEVGERPPRDWVDGLVLWCQTEVWDKLSNPRSAEILAGHYPDQGELIVYDPELLRSKKLFWSESSFAFRAPQ